MKRIAFYLMAALILMTGCKDDKDVAVTGVELDKKTLIELPVNGSITLTATVKPDNATNKEVEWSTGNANVADVSQAGVVTAKNIAGETKITVKSKADPTKTASVDVKVIIPKVEVTGVELNKTEHTFIIGDAALQLTATVKPDNADVKEVTWTSSKPAVATVSITGLVTPVALGETTITVKTVDGNKEAKCEIVVNPIAVTKLELKEGHDEIELVFGDEFELEVTKIEPENATIKTLTWSSENTEIATVDDKGKVKAVGVGETTVTATAHNGVKAESKVKVVMIRLPQSRDLLVREYAGFNASNVDEIKELVTWASSNSGVATVDDKGLVRAISLGETTISAKATVDGVNYEAKCNIKVIAGGTDPNGFECDPDADPDILKLFHGASSKKWTWDEKPVDGWKGTVWGNGGYSVDTDIEWWGFLLNQIGDENKGSAYMQFSSDGVFSTTNSFGETETGTFCISMKDNVKVKFHEYSGKDPKDDWNIGKLHVSVPVLHGINGGNDDTPKFYVKYFFIMKLTEDEMIIASGIEHWGWGNTWFWRFKVKKD